MKLNAITILVDSAMWECCGTTRAKVSATPFAELQLPDGKITYKVVNGGDKILPRDIKRIDIYDISITKTLIPFMYNTI